jgi:hypothetical protein
VVWAEADNPPGVIVPELEHFFKHFKTSSGYGHFGFARD